MPVVPAFTVVRSTGEAPGFAPAASSWLRRRPSPRPPGPDTLTLPGVPRAGRRPFADAPTRLRAAHPPRSTGFERVDDEEALRHRFLAYTFPSRSPDPTHPAVLGRPDFVAAASRPHPTFPGPGCRQLHRAATTTRRWWSLTSIRNNSASRRTTCSSTPITLTPSNLVGSLISTRCPSARIASFAVPHATCERAGDRRDAHVVHDQGEQPPRQCRPRQLRARSRGRGRVLQPHRPTRRAPKPADPHEQRRRPPPGRDVREPAFDRPTRTALRPAPAAELLPGHRCDPALQDRTVWAQVLTRDDQAMVVQADERIQIRAREGKVGQVEVLAVAPVSEPPSRRTSTPARAPTRRPPPTPPPRRAPPRRGLRPLHAHL